MAWLSPKTAETALHSQEKRHPAPALDSYYGRSGTASCLSPHAATDGGTHSRPELVRVSAQAPVCRCHRPLFEGPTAAHLGHLDLGRGYRRLLAFPILGFSEHSWTFPADTP